MNAVPSASSYLSRFIPVIFTWIKSEVILRTEHPCYTTFLSFFTRDTNLILSTDVSIYILAFHCHS